ncbi:GntR family transcriptional regulator [Pseudooceanicola sp. CBS1P-1]|uniref:FCD domain-containing protein n=1 Tax=Pseudooceanicola albus TaxID=2692189 RepID=A0A6L7G3N3_9RHOB|nr:MULTISPECIES: GntR family transcriptional regulator [Pseudooceanicola]MBT9385026.1 GntR family transcriptional regulator [Pseudooceanicola endophyticus]MXN17980.1 FCD domain-containing protein [Pseudooceanicola albus]
MADKVNGSERVAEDLTAAIHGRRIAPGTKLNEDEVGAVFGVSRTVARAALQALAHRQLVELRRNRGAYVARPSAREAREVFEARLLLEPPLARRAADRMTGADLDRLRSHLSPDATSASGPGARLSGDYHAEIARIAGQQTLTEILLQLIARSSLILSLYWRRSEAAGMSHAGLQRAFEARDADRAEAEMSRHLGDLVADLDLDGGRVPQSLREALGT